MKLSHKQKVKMARKMRTRFEIKMRVPIFTSRAWILRSAAIQARLKKKRKWFGNTWFAGPGIKKENWFIRLMRFLRFNYKRF